MCFSDQIHSAADFLAARLEGRKPQVGIVLGSGLGKLAERIQDPIVVPYASIPDFPVSTAIGHKGNFICGTLGGKCVLAMQGRVHYYEGYGMNRVTLCIRVMRLLGVDTLFVSNAAGATNPAYKVGDMIVIRDHINALPNPLIGENLDEFGTRFPDMTCAYDRDLQALADKVAGSMGLTLPHGVYFASSGPSYETPAEVRFYKMIGADLLGMSTIPEVIVARHCGMRVFGMSVVTNICNQENRLRNLNDGEDVVAKANEATTRMSALFEQMIAAL